MPRGGFLTSEQEPGRRDDRPPTTPERALLPQLLAAPQVTKARSSRAEAAPTAPNEQPTPPQSDTRAVPTPAEYEQARRSLIHFACTIDVPGRPVSEDAENP